MFRIIYAVMFMALLVGCHKGSDTIDEGGGATSADILLSSFSATRSDGGVWSTGDAAGVIMISHGGSSTETEIDSRCYVATSSGSESDFSGDAALSYMDGGENYVAAYYPYSLYLNEQMSLDIDIRELTDDLLVATPQSSSCHDDLNLRFEPLLAKVSFRIETADGFDYSMLEDMSISLSGLTPCAEYDMEASHFTLGEGEEFELKSSNGGAISSATRGDVSGDFSASIIPQSATEAYVNLSLADGTSYSVSLDVATMSSGMLYTYSAEVSNSGIELQSLTITPWGSGGSQSGVASIIPDGYYAIYDEDDFRRYFSYDSNIGDKLILMNDLNLGSDWDMSKNLLSGALFDGNGHTITYDFSESYDDHKDEAFNEPLNIHALFCFNSGTIRNLTIAGDIDLTTGDYTDCEFAAIAYQNSGVIQNCVSKLNFTANKIVRYGGITVMQNGGSDSAIVNCCNLGDVKIAEGHMAVSEDNSHLYGVGGIMVYSESNGTLRNCYNGGEIVVSDGVGYVGAVVSYLFSTNEDTVDCLYSSTKCSGIDIIGNSDDLGANFFYDNTILYIDDDKMQSLAFVEVLNNEAYEIMSTSGIAGAEGLKAWKIGGSGYPELDALLSPYYTDLTSGMGTAEFPYIISTSQQLVDLSSEVAAGDDKEGVYFALSNNIYLAWLSSEWVPIGTVSTPFQGHFSSVSGNRESVTLGIETYNVQHNSLFGVVGELGHISDIDIKGSITANYYCGGVAAINYGTVTRCNNYASIYSEGAYSYVGGVVAVNMDGGVVEDCTNEGSISEEGFSVTIGTVVALNMGTTSNISSTVEASHNGYETKYTSADNYIIGVER